MNEITRQTNKALKLDDIMKQYKHHSIPVSKAQLSKLLSIYNCVGPEGRKAPERQCFHLCSVLSVQLGACSENPRRSRQGGEAYGFFSNEIRQGRAF